MKKAIKFLYILIIIPLLCLFFASFNEIKAKEEKTVRVGWFESVYNTTDSNGRKSGYSYEYQQKLAVYTGWKYEYVEASWPELLKMLKEGQINLLSDVSYTPERANEMLFSALPMGYEDYYIYKSPKNKEIIIDDYTTFNGKKIAINRGSIMVGLFEDWARANKVNAIVEEIDYTVDVALDKLDKGIIDMYVSIDGSIDIEKAVPLCKFGSSDFFFAVSNDRSDLIDDLNYAMNRVFNDNAYYNQELHSKYFKALAFDLYLNETEKNWLTNHGKIKIGYQDNYLAFCAKDPKTGELTGALKDFLNIASNSLKNAYINFETIAYPTSTEAMDALKKGEIDCVFPSNLSMYDGEEKNLFMTNPIMRTEITAIVLESEQQNFVKRENVVVAVNSGNENYLVFLEDNFPKWDRIICSDTNECLKAISEGKADCLLLSNYRYNSIASLCKKYKLTTLSTGVEIDYYFALNRSDSVLYSIMNKVINIVPVSSINSALSYYYTEDARIGFGEFLAQNMGIIIVVLAAIAIFISILVLRNIMIDRKSKARQLLIKATEIDEKTQLYNKIYFIEYAIRLYNENPTKPMDAIEINIERFHFVNDLNGRDFGDQVLRELSDEIRNFIREKGGIAGHSEGDRFYIYCPHLEEYRSLFERLQGRVDMLTSNATIRIRMGVMPWKADVDPSKQIAQASIACDMAMTEIKEHLVVFDDEMSIKEKNDQRLLNDLRHSIENKEFVVYFQPKYDITSDTPKLVGVEALVRWMHSDLGFIVPNDFIPLFEKNGQIALLDKYVRAESIKQIALWKEKYGFVLPVSVNISRIEILDKTFENSLNQLLEEYGLEQSALNLEVTESAYIDDANQFIKVINALRTSGYKIEMDDFGSGYSSLNMLSLMPIDILKMDRAFISDIETSKKNVRLVELILGIAKNMKVPVIAEGVETKGQLDILKKLGCQIIQGYYFSKPLPFDEFEEKILNKK